MPQDSNARIRSLVEYAAAQKAQEVHLQMMKRVTSLKTIAAVAPMLGFLAAISGILGLFTQGIGTARSSLLSALAESSWESLAPIALSLVVATIAYCAYNYFVSRVHAFDVEMANGSSELLDSLRHHLARRIDL